ncbi:MAG: hypothetical protein ACTSV1_06955 [Alphaproteobacteria bacterium]
MTDIQKTEEEEQDSAWVSIETPFDAEWLAHFISDPGRVVRINSLMLFDEFEQIGPAEYRMKAQNLSNDKLVETTFKAEAEGSDLIIRYSDGLKSATRFHIEDKPGGVANLIITDEYGGGTSKQEREARIDEVDKSLIKWGQDVHKYVHQLDKWGWLPGFKWYMGGFWLRMKPLARRIAYLLIMITIAEFVMFLMVFTVFWLELDKYLR